MSLELEHCLSSRRFIWLWRLMEQVIDFGRNFGDSGSSVL